MFCVANPGRGSVDVGLVGGEGGRRAPQQHAPAGERERGGGVQEHGVLHVPHRQRAQEGLPHEAGKVHRTVSFSLLFPFFFTLLCLCPETFPDNI